MCYTYGWVTFAEMGWEEEGTNQKNPKVGFVLELWGLGKGRAHPCDATTPHQSPVALHDMGMRCAEHPDSLLASSGSPICERCKKKQIPKS